MDQYVLTGQAHLDDPVQCTGTALVSHGLARL